jgi:1-phosphatidylinositol-3-phosphate 5-kinase
LTHLVDKEKEHPKRRIKGDEKVGLRTLLGWEGRDAQGKGMSGLTGFIRHQEISILVSHHVPTAEPTETPSVPTSSSNLPQPGLKLCGKPQWITYCHFSHDPNKDRSLGEALLGFVSDGKLPCEQSGCIYTRGRHQLHLIHGSVRIVVKVDTAEVHSTTEGIHAWESCAICDARNAQLELSDGSW